MEIVSANMSQIAWKEIAAKKQQRLEDGGKGQTLKQMVDEGELYKTTGKTTVNNVSRSTFTRTV